MTYFVLSLSQTQTYTRVVQSIKHQEQSSWSGIFDLQHVDQSNCKTLTECKMSKGARLVVLFCEAIDRSTVRWMCIIHNTCCIVELWRTCFDPWMWHASYISLRNLLFSWRHFQQKRSNDLIIYPTVVLADSRMRVTFICTAFQESSIFHRHRVKPEA